MVVTNIIYYLIFLIDSFIHLFYCVKENIMIATNESSIDMSFKFNHPKHVM